MKSYNDSSPEPLSRRDFLRSSAFIAAVGAVGASGQLAPGYAAGSDRLRVGLIGCGARGIGAAMNCVLSAPGVEIVALGDVFADRVQAALKQLKDNSQGKEWSCSQEWKHADQVKATPDTCFTGFDAYGKVIASGVDMVILAGPPHFRPEHLRAAIAAGKHVFMEKPVAVDPVGIRSILASSEQARQKGLGIVAGTQRRHQNSYIEVMKRLHAGDLGDLLGGECYWNGGCVRHYGFYHERQPGWTDMEYVLRNWYFYSWLSGDHIAEQHVHNLDVINWAMGSPPVEAIGVGGRQWRTEPQYGNIYDHFGVRYRYPNGAIIASVCRQIDGTQPLVTEMIVGSRGRAWSGRIEGQKPWRWEGANPNPYEQEHADLISSIRAGNPLNEGRAVAEATLTAIMGRMSAYTGQAVKWEWVIRESELDLTPAEVRGGYALGPAPRPPVPRGNDELI
jgi:myo-inositol 2-dehydrogenase / D-chiro-inositol 1-dehydrogenase